jgi:OHCU decarboxylase
MSAVRAEAGVAVVLPSRMTGKEFAAAFGALYEHSPWVAQEVFAGGQVTSWDHPDSLHAACREVVLGAGHERQLALLRAHPQLAVRQGELTSASQGEQTGAGLQHCSAAELAEFTDLNQRYLQRFGFPFIIAVRGLNRQDILEAFRARIDNPPEVEFRTALEQVCRIGRLRLQDCF